MIDYDRFIDPWPRRNPPFTDDFPIFQTLPFIDNFPFKPPFSHVFFPNFLVLGGGAQL
jgi:hypothetical protein